MEGDPWDPHMVANLQGPMLEDITDVAKQQWQIATWQQGDYGISCQSSLGLCTLLNRNVKNCYSSLWFLLKVFMDLFNMP